MRRRSVYIADSVRGDFPIPVTHGQAVLPRRVGRGCASRYKRKRSETGASVPVQDLARERVIDRPNVSGQAVAEDARRVNGFLVLQRVGFSRGLLLLCHAHGREFF